MKNVLSALKALAADAVQLEIPAKAAAAAGVLAPLIAAVAGANVTAPEIAADLILFGGVAGVLQKLLAKPAPAPTPAPAPVKPAAKK